MTLILESNLPALRRFARRLCVTPELTADIVQQTCLKAWMARSAFEPDRPALPWLFQIMKNEYLQTMRGTKPITNLDDATFDRHLQDLSHHDVTLDLLSLWKQLRLLPHDQREAVILVIGIGLSYEEAGALCDCFAGTIKSRVSRGKMKLREAMGIQLDAA